MTNDEWNRLKQDCYRSNTVAMTDEGTIDFSPRNYRETEFNGVSVSYDEYLDIQRATGGVDRGYFAMCFYNSGGIADCKGRIEAVYETKERIVFNRIFVSGMYGDGTFFDGKEDHIPKISQNIRSPIIISFKLTEDFIWRNGHGKTAG